MFDFENANEGQRKAIDTADGPVLITAGPGTGKTYALVQRAIYPIEECGVKYLMYAGSRIVSSHILDDEAMEVHQGTMQAGGVSL